MTAGSPQREAEAERFTSPRQVNQRRYEALRAYFVDGLSYAEAGMRFGYTRWAMSTWRASTGPGSWSCTEAREKALTPAQYRSPLGRRPYDLRHAGVSLWLNSGVPATEVAHRAGHGVAVLLKIYAHCIDGQADAANQRITDVLGTTEPEPGPGDEGDEDSEKAS
jgi:integrase